MIDNKKGNENKEYLHLDPCWPHSNCSDTWVDYEAFVSLPIEHFLMAQYYLQAKRPVAFLLSHRLMKMMMIIFACFSMQRRNTLAFPRSVIRVRLNCLGRSSHLRSLLAEVEEVMNCFFYRNRNVAMHKLWLDDEIFSLEWNLFEFEFGNGGGDGGGGVGSLAWYISPLNRISPRES